MSDPDNYRGITLLSCLGKLFTSAINSRLRSFLELRNQLGEEQSGFRAAYSTCDHVFSLHVLIELYKQKGEKLFAAFVDYKKAFDLVDHSSLWVKLLAEGISGRVLKAVQSIYANAKSVLRANGKLSEEFVCNIGVRQGENLSPLLFALFLNDFEEFMSTR